MSLNKKNIGVVFGGCSKEHDVSINSAITVITALRRGQNKNRFIILPIYIDRAGNWHPPKTGEKVLKEQKPLDIMHTFNMKSYFHLIAQICENIDIWFPVLHGPNGEDGTIQGFFKLIDKPFVGSGILGSALGMDKVAMKSAFGAAGLPQLPYISAKSFELQEEQSFEKLILRIENSLNYPLFVKPANLGSSVGISKVISRLGLRDALIKAAELDQKLVIEEGVTARELECGLLGGKETSCSVVGEVRFKAEWYDYETKYTQGSSETIIPAAIPKDVTSKIQELSLKAWDSISANGLARVDFFYDQLTGDLWINEINTFPGFTNKSMYPLLWEASGVNIEQLVAKLIDITGE